MKQLHLVKDEHSGFQLLESASTYHMELEQKQTFSLNTVAVVSPAHASGQPDPGSGAVPAGTIQPRSSGDVHPPPSPAPVRGHLEVGKPSDQTGAPVRLITLPTVTGDAPPGLLPTDGPEHGRGRRIPQVAKSQCLSEASMAIALAHLVPDKPAPPSAVDVDSFATEVRIENVQPTCAPPCPEDTWAPMREAWLDPEQRLALLRRQLPWPTDIPKASNPHIQQNFEVNRTRLLNKAIDCFMLQLPEADAAFDEYQVYMATFRGQASRGVKIIPPLPPAPEGSSLTEQQRQETWDMLHDDEAIQDDTGCFGPSGPKSDPTGDSLPPAPEPPALEEEPDTDADDLPYDMRPTDDSDLTNRTSDGYERRGVWEKTEHPMFEKAWLGEYDKHGKFETKNGWQAKSRKGRKLRSDRLSLDIGPATVLAANLFEDKTWLTRCGNYYAFLASEREDQFVDDEADASVDMPDAGTPGTVITEKNVFTKTGVNREYKREWDRIKRAETADKSPDTRSRADQVRDATRQATWTQGATLAQYFRYYLRNRRLDRAEVLRNKLLASKGTSMNEVWTRLKVICELGLWDCSEFLLASHMLRAYGKDIKWKGIDVYPWGGHLNMLRTVDDRSIDWYNLSFLDVWAFVTPVEISFCEGWTDTGLTMDDPMGEVGWRAALTKCWNAIMHALNGNIDDPHIYTDMIDSKEVIDLEPEPAVPEESKFDITADLTNPPEQEHSLAMLGALFHAAGYNYLGPGNFGVVDGVAFAAQPVNALDGIARTHDRLYSRARSPQQFDYADRIFIREARNLGTPAALAAAAALSVQRDYRSWMNGSSDMTKYLLANVEAGYAKYLQDTANQRAHTATGNTTIIQEMMTAIVKAAQKPSNPASVWPVQPVLNTDLPTRTIRNPDSAKYIGNIALAGSTMAIKEVPEMTVNPVVALEDVDVTEFSWCWSPVQWPGMPMTLSSVANTVAITNSEDSFSKNRTRTGLIDTPALADIVSQYFDGEQAPSESNPNWTPTGMTFDILTKLMLNHIDRRAAVPYFDDTSLHFAGIYTSPTGAFSLAQFWPLSANAGPAVPVVDAVYISYEYYAALLRPSNQRPVAALPVGFEKEGWDNECAVVFINGNTMSGDQTALYAAAHLEYPFQSVNWEYEFRRADTFAVIPVPGVNPLRWNRTVGRHRIVGPQERVLFVDTEPTLQGVAIAARLLTVGVNQLVMNSPVAVDIGGDIETALDVQTLQDLNCCIAEWYRSVGCAEEIPMAKRWVAEMIMAHKDLAYTNYNGNPGNSYFAGVVRIDQNAWPIPTNLNVPTSTGANVRATFDHNRYSASGVPAQAEVFTRAGRTSCLFSSMPSEARALLALGLAYRGSRDEIRSRWLFSYQDICDMMKISWAASFIFDATEVASGARSDLMSSIDVLSPFAQFNAGIVNSSIKTSWDCISQWELIRYNGAGCNLLGERGVAGAPIPNFRHVPRQPYAGLKALCDKDFDDMAVENQWTMYRTSGKSWSGFTRTSTFPNDPLTLIAEPQEGEGVTPPLLAWLAWTRTTAAPVAAEHPAVFVEGIGFAGRIGKPYLPRFYASNTIIASMSTRGVLNASTLARGLDTSCSAPCCLTVLLYDQVGNPMSPFYKVLIPDALRASVSGSGAQMKAMTTAGLQSGEEFLLASDGSRVARMLVPLYMRQKSAPFRQSSTETTDVPTNSGAEGSG